MSLPGWMASGLYIAIAAFLCALLVGGWALPAGEPGSSVTARPAQPPAPASEPLRTESTERQHAAHISTFAERYRIGRRLSSQIYEAARAERVSPALAFGLVRVESGFDPTVVGLGGAIGLTQIRPRTAKELSPHVTPSDLYSPHLNLQLGFRYLHSLLERFDHDVTLALAAYNRGPSHVEQQLARGRSPGTAYARKVLRDIERASGSTL